MFTQQFICTEKPSKRDLVLLGKACQTRKEGFKYRVEQNALRGAADFPKKKKKGDLVGFDMSNNFYFFILLLCFQNSFL